MYSLTVLPFYWHRYIIINFICMHEEQKFTLHFSFCIVRYKKDKDIAFVATCSLHNLLNATLLSESGPPLLDFEVINSLFCLFS